MSQTRPTRYLYVPFTNKELDEDFCQILNGLIRSAKWKKKKFNYLIHGLHDLSKVPADSNIYVVGHGTDISPNHKKSSITGKLGYDEKAFAGAPLWEWPYFITSGKTLVHISTVAERMLKDGLIEITNPTIKLYFCDTSFKAETMALRFACILGETETKPFRIDYYPNQLLTGNYSMLHDKQHKKATDACTGKITRASKVRTTLFVENKMVFESEVTINEKPKARV